MNPEAVGFANLKSLLVYPIKKLEQLDVHSSIFASLACGAL